MQVRSEYNQQSIYAQRGARMIQTIAATFEDGVFKPDQRPTLAESTRVRLDFEAIDVDSGESLRQQAWANLKQLWQKSTFNSQGDRLNRDQLHERR
jgi:predicted DNA-binding antitoxin AbrB/MazE fold protein